MKRMAMTALVATMLLSGAFPAVAQDRNNEEEVVKVDARASQFSYRDNEVIVKFKPTAAVQMRANVKGQFATSGVNRIDAVLQEIGALSFEGLMPLTGVEQARRSAPAINGKPVVAEDLSKLYRVRFDGTKVQSVHEVIAKLEAFDEVEYAEPNYLVYATGNKHDELIYDDPLHSEQWGLNAVNLRRLWNVPTITDERPIIGILDTGVEITHPDLADNAWINEAELNGVEGVDDDGNGFIDDIYGWDFVNQCNIIDDYNGHGTHCAGIAAAMAGNEKGGVGANPNAYIMSIAVMQSDGVGDIATIIKGIDYAAANGVDVLSMSIGTYASSIALEQALGKAYQSAVLVAAAGNDGTCINPHKCIHPTTGIPNDGAPMFPAAYNFVLGVQAAANNGSLTSFSNYDCDGPQFSGLYNEHQLYNYELRAPGALIMSTYRGGKYKSLNGTSMACPIVAGGISRLLQCKEYASKELLFGDLIHAAGGGMVDFYAAYQITDADRQPSLQLVTYQLNDSTGGDGDLRADAGETIDLYPTLRNNWGNAENIVISLEVAENEDETIIELIDNNVDFGYALSSYAKGKAANPIRFKVRDNCVDGRHISLVLRATCDNIAEELVQEFVITAENGVEIGGMITEDLTLYPDVHYIVTRTIAVPEGVTLTILPGTVLKFKEGAGFSASANTLVCDGTPEQPIIFTMADHTTGYMQAFNFNYNTLRYVKFMDLRIYSFPYSLWDAYLENCEVINCYSIHYFFSATNFINSNIYYSEAGTSLFSFSTLNTSNLIGNINIHINDIDNYNKTLANCNSFGNRVSNSDLFSVAFDSDNIEVYTPESPNYLGSAREDIVKYWVYDMNHPTRPVGYGVYDLSNMLTQPVAEAHGIVWKVVVNGYDAQDEYELLPPLGVGKHKFEVYFNRPMNKAVAPMIAMGVRMPYTQTPIAEEGSWNDEGTIYTAYLTITGKSATDGINRIYVAEAEDDEYFEIPIENCRFNVNVQAAGSMSTGLAAEAGLGKVTLSWETDEEDFEDLLGYNIMRYTDYVDSTYVVDYDKYGDRNKHLVVTGDTIIINDELIDSEAQSFVDYNVVPATTYYYVIKQLTTSFNNHDLSNVVAATPLTAIKGDANGSMSVDVADVVTEVNYMTGQLEDQVFIFEAADVNSDLVVNVLDVVGTVNIIKAPVASASAADNAAVYTVEDGILYVDCPVALGGLQLRLQEAGEITPMEALANFEFVTDDQGEEGTLVLAYSMTGRSIATGKQALVAIGDATVSEIILSDKQGRNVVVVDGNAAGVGSVEAAQMQLPYPTTFSEALHIPYVVGKSGVNDVRIAITDLAGREVNRYETTATYGSYEYTWQPTGVESGMYLVSLYVDGVLMHTAKVIYNR